MPPRFSKEHTRPTSFFAGAPKDQPRTSPCEASCPAGHDIQRTILMIQDSRFEEALENVHAKHPFPGVCGRACFHPCETPCNRQFYDQAVSIRALERAAYDLADRTKVRRPIARAKTGKKIAIVGSGPAGLTCAYFSALFGHHVTVFEALPVIGGMPRVGIPDHRLPKKVVDEEVDWILDLGVEVKTNMQVGKDIAFKEVKDTHDACLIATGAWKERRLDVPGSELAMDALAVLTRIIGGERPDLGKKILVVGGGGVAFDVASTLRRLGEPEVHIACLEPGDKMVAPEEDVIQAMEEGVIIHNSKTFTRIVSDNGRVKGIECMDVKSFRFDAEGRLQVEVIGGSEHVIPADTVITAIGETPHFDFLEDMEGFRFSRHGTLDVDEKTLATPLEGVFAAGDAVTGPGSIAQAIGQGRLAAVSVDCYLRGRAVDEICCIYIDAQGCVQTEFKDSFAKEAKPQHIVGFDEILNPDYYEKQNRVPMTRLHPPESLRGFKEVNRGYTPEEAVREASRCFHCGHCAECGTCAEICPMDIIAMGEKGPYVAYPKECWHCGGCRINCPCGCIYYEFPLSMLI
ncbi:MAG: FAD-dependent oxidoreductase [Deltaproteobacteria bacterium]|nr:FAD-dependent oxidoreductase [Deltaproteobacteria bacterium]